MQVCSFRVLAQMQIVAAFERRHDRVAVGVLMGTCEVNQLETRYSVVDTVPLFHNGSQFNVSHEAHL